MKRLLTALLCLPLLAFGAEQYSDGVAFEQMPPPFYPFALSGGYLAVTPADFTTPDVKGQTLRYTQTTTAFAYTHPCNECLGLIFGAGYVGTQVNWKENPFFNETDYHYVNFNGGVYTTVFPDWQWTATVGIFVDTDEFDFGDYALYQGVLWGNYALRPWLSVSTGFILEVGLNKNRGWPILGLRFQPGENWRINAVYPIDISVEWDLAQCWSTAASIQFLRNRHRVSDTQPLPKAIFEYRTWGAEMDLIYRPASWLYLKGFVGATFTGELKVTNRNDDNGIHFKFGTSPYIGFNSVLSF